MKRIFQLNICAILLTVLAVGWLWPVRARAEAETDGWYEEDGSRFYYADGEALKDCIAEIDGGFYYFRDDGTLLLEDETCLVSDGNGTAAWIRAGWDNVLIAGDWYIDDGADPAESYYYGTDFAAVCGPSVVDDVFYLFDYETGLLLGNQKVVIDGAWWESDAQGVLSPTGIPADGWAADDDGNRYYYLDGEALSGGFYEIDGQSRFFHNDGHLARNESLYLDSHWVRFDENGCVIPGSGEQHTDSSDEEKENPGDGKEENPSGSDEAQTAADPVSPPAEGWMTVDGERYYYRDRKPISAGRHSIEWVEYYFDENGRMLHDCIVDGRILDSDGRVVQSGMANLGDQQYYVNPTTHLIEKNTELNIDSTLYTADSDGRLQRKPLPAESGTESATEDSQTDESSQDPQYSSDPDSDPDPDADYVPTNEEDSSEQEELPAGGSIRYSDNYLPGENPTGSTSSPASPAADNPTSGILFWRGAWQEIHGSEEKPIRIRIYGKDAAILDNGTVLRDAFVYSSEGVFGFDQYGNALPEGLAARYGKLFYVTAPDPNAEILVLLMS